ncbi:MAG TPA: hypothetical protein VHL98_04710 [Microvirga sp.]|nr:hypothetical protein [Microvirga sp.]
MGWRVVPVAAPPLFPLQFWLTARHLARNPLARSIPTRQCVSFFGDDLLRQVPPPDQGLAPFARLGGIRVKLNSRFLDAADWQRQVYSLHSFRFDLAREIAAGLPYRETETYRMLRERMRAGKLNNNRVPIDTEDKLDRYCAYTEWLVGSIREHGMRMRRDARHFEGGAFDIVRARDEETEETDIRVAVDANGRFLRLNSGRHRLAVAHALGLPAIPAQIRLVHVRWLVKLTRDHGGPPHEALRTWLRGFRSAAPGAG